MEAATGVDAVATAPPDRTGDAADEAEAEEAARAARAAATVALSGEMGSPNSRRHSSCCSARSCRCCWKEQQPPAVGREESRLRRRVVEARTRLLEGGVAMVVAVCVPFLPVRGGVELVVAAAVVGLMLGLLGLTWEPGDPHEERRAGSGGGWRPQLVVVRPFAPGVVGDGLACTMADLPLCVWVELGHVRHD